MTWYHPEAACTSWRVLYKLLEEFEADPHTHIHLGEQYPVCQGSNWKKKRPLGHELTGSYGCVHPVLFALQAMGQTPVLGRFDLHCAEIERTRCETG